MLRLVTQASWLILLVVIVGVFFVLIADIPLTAMLKICAGRREGLQYLRRGVQGVSDTESARAIAQCNIFHLDSAGFWMRSTLNLWQNAR